MKITKNKQGGGRGASDDMMRDAAILSLLAFGLAACGGTETAPNPISPDVQLAPSIEEIHQAAFVIDAHADIALTDTSPLYLGADGRSKVAPDKLKAGGFDAVVMALATGPKPRTEEGRATAYREVAAKYKTIENEVYDVASGMAFATTPEEVYAISESGRIAVILALQNVQSLEGDLARLDEYYADGVRLFGLTHMGHNDFSDSSRPLFDGATGTYEVEEEHGGLSELGRAAVQRIDALGGIIDVSQMSKNATLQAIELAETPVIASHSNVKALSDVTRNLSDEEIDRIGETGGVIHIAAFSAYLVDLSSPDMRARIRDVRLAAGLPETYAYPYELYWELEDETERLTFLNNMRQLVGQEDVARMVDHIDYVVDRIGIDHVGIGSDFNHGGGVVGFSEADAAQTVTAELVARGYSPEDINKIWGGNFLRLLDVAASR